MQALYALRQVDASNQQMAVDGISDLFQPDLNSMKPQNRQQLEGFRQLATLLFEEGIRDRKNAADDETETPKSVLKAANDALLYYRNISRKDRERLGQQLISEVQGIYDDYLRVLLLLVELGHMARLDNERVYPDPDETPFVYESDLNDNVLIKSLLAYKPLETESLRRNVSWAGEQGVIRKAYREVLKTDETYIAYCQQPTHNAADDHTLVQYVMRQLIFKHETFRDLLAEIDLSWVENSEVVRGLATRTLKSVNSAKGLALEPLTDDWDEDQLFLNTLFQKALENDVEYEQLLADQLQNWDVDRVAMIDRIILKLATTELLNFPGIPTKVTINEYIDLAKQYSTPKSGKFVNGILDNLSEKLTASGQLRKSGRGLIDNK